MSEKFDNEFVLALRAAFAISDRILHVALCSTTCSKLLPKIRLARTTFPVPARKWVLLRSENCNSFCTFSDNFVCNLTNGPHSDSSLVQVPVATRAHLAHQPFALAQHFDFTFFAHFRERQLWPSFHQLLLEFFICVPCCFRCILRFTCLCIQNVLPSTCSSTRTAEYKSTTALHFICTFRHGE